MPATTSTSCVQCAVLVTTSCLHLTFNEGVLAATTASHSHVSSNACWLDQPPPPAVVWVLHDGSEAGFCVGVQISMSIDNNWVDQELQNKQVTLTSLLLIHVSHPNMSTAIPRYLTQQLHVLCWLRRVWTQTSGGRLLNARFDK